VAYAIVYFAFEGRDGSPVVDAIEQLPARFQAAIYSDIERVAEYGFKAPVSVRSIKGHSPLFEIRTGGYRTFFVVDRNEMWVLHCCKKDDQRRGIEMADERMRLVLER
jgi:phage-related protein